jgi:four helix bundle protein
MGNDNTSRAKSKRFAVRIIGLYKKLVSEKREFVLSKQILRSGTSIGANLAEAECAISRREFLAKQYISLKECMETLYWLELLHETDFMSKGDFDSMITDCEELRKMLSSSTKTLRNFLHPPPSPLHPSSTPSPLHLPPSNRTELP